MYKLQLTPCSSAQMSCSLFSSLCTILIEPGPVLASLSSLLPILTPFVQNSTASALRLYLSVSSLQRRNPVVSFLLLLEHLARSTG